MDDRVRHECERQPERERGERERGGGGEEQAEGYYNYFIQTNKHKGRSERDERHCIDAGTDDGEEGRTESAYSLARRKGLTTISP